jgi:aminoglycoside 6-adenylyltransferase
MRSESEMLDLILGVAKEDERIRAVTLNGSRANPNAPKDIFMDYDVVYVVTETESFLKEKEWIDVFGERIIMQEPDQLDKMLGRDVDLSKCYGYLMQFSDGNRIDLHLETLDRTLERFGTDSLTVTLLDKENILPKLPPASDQDYWVKKPSFAQYLSMCNNFWWVAPYCAKGLWRKEILYAIDAMNDYVRDALLQMLSWDVCIDRGFEFSLGKSLKCLNNYLDPDLWNRLMTTYNLSDSDSAWNALITACELFDETASAVGEAFGYMYNKEEATKSFAFIRHIQELPRTAAEIY